MNSFFAHLLTYLPIIPAAVMCCTPMRNHFKYSKLRTYADMIITISLSCLIASWLDYSTSINFTPLAIIMFLVFFIAYHSRLTVHISKSLAVFCYVLALMSIISSTTTALDAVFNPDAGQDTITWLYIAGQLGFSVVAALLLFSPLRTYGIELVDTLDIPGTWFTLVPQSLLYTAVCLVMTPNDYRSLYEGHNFRNYVIIILFMALSLITGVISFYRVSVGVRNHERAETSLSILELQEAQFEQQQRYLEESAELRHDFRQTMYTLNGLLQAKDYSGLLEYFESYFRKIPENPVRRFCLNQPLNALLNYYAGVAQTDHIALRWQIDPLDDISISDVSLCTVVGNILENAVAACRDTAIEGRFIQLSIIDENGNTLFVVESNSCRKNLKKHGETYISSKHDGGIGLGSVTRIVQDHGGSADFSDSDGVFYSNIMIPLTKDH
ncbi:MAG: GHKL domain-containing protein [Oscillospiraceae bacterium]|nr:GHKL domain-containing protein [Oscillospiraceae bacterium]